MATKKKKKTIKKLPVESIVDRLIREMTSLSMKDRFEVITRIESALGVTLDTDNYGQIIIYTDMMYGNDGEVVPFEVDCLKEHVEYEEEHECEF